MAALLTLDVAKKHLRVDHTDDDADIQRKIDQASAIVLDYIKKTVGTPNPEDPSIVDWTDATVPPPVAAAIEILLSKLYDDRNAGATDNEVAMGYLPKTVTSLLHRFRDPALA
jgi:uncharacterized phage protein (predicted DNA packaging)